MLSRHRAYYGLLACLVATLTLGIQPLRLGKMAAQQPASQSAPAQESDDEKQESEEESEELAPVRRKALLGVEPEGEGLFLPSSPARSAPKPPNVQTPCRELAARNGIGGPLRL
jgi:hypothetical protein